MFSGPMFLTPVNRTIDIFLYDVASLHGYDKKINLWLADKPDWCKNAVPTYFLFYHRTYKTTKWTLKANSHVLKLYNGPQRGSLYQTAKNFY